MSSVSPSFTLGVPDAGSSPPGVNAPPGAPPQGPPFQSALDDQWARTAPAEGQNQSQRQDSPLSDGDFVNASSTGNANTQATGKPANPRPSRRAATAAEDQGAGGSSETAANASAVAADTQAAATTGAAATGSPNSQPNGSKPAGSQTAATQAGDALATSVDGGTPGDQSAATATQSASTIANAAAATVAGNQSSLTGADAAAGAAAGSSAPITATSTGSGAAGPDSAMTGAATTGATTTGPTAASPAGVGAATPGAASIGSAAGATGSATTGTTAAVAGTANNPAGQTIAPTDGQSSPGSPALPASSQPGSGATTTTLGGGATAPAGSPPAATAATALGTPKSAPTGSASSTASAAVNYTAGSSSSSQGSDAGSQGHGEASANGTSAGDARPIATAAQAAPGGVPDASLTSPAASVQSSSSTAAPQTPALSYGVNLDQSIEAIHDTIELATRQGLAQARIALHPEELGEISIRLSQSSAGLVARVTADTQAAAQALADGHAELHQSLSSLGVSLLRLDIGSSGQTGAQGAPGEQARNGNAAGSGATNRRAVAQDDHENLDASSESEPATDTLTLAGSTLINVLA